MSLLLTLTTHKTLIVIPDTITPLSHPDRNASFLNWNADFPNRWQTLATGLSCHQYSSANLTISKTYASSG